MRAPSRDERPKRTLNDDGGNDDDDDANNGDDDGDDGDDGANNGDDDGDNGDDDTNPSPPLFSPGLKRKGAAVRECAEYSRSS